MWKQDKIKLTILKHFYQCDGILERILNKLVSNHLIQKYTLTNNEFTSFWGFL